MGRLYYIFQWISKFSKRILYSILGLLFIGFAVIYFATNFLDLDRYKQSILEQIEEKTDHRIEFVESNLVVFPYPGLELKYINVYDGDIQIAKINKIIIEISILPLLKGDLEIRGLSLNSGQLEIYRDKKGSFTSFKKILNKDKTETTKVDSPPKKETGDELTPEYILGLLPNKISLVNIHINLHDGLHKKEYTLYIWKAQLDLVSYARSVQLGFYGKIDDKKIEIYQDIYWAENSFSYQSLRANGTILLDQFSVSLLEDILIIFPNADFSITTISGRIHLSKITDDLTKMQLKEVIIKDFILQSGTPFGDIRGETWITYSDKDERLGFDDISLEWQNRIKTKGWGFITFNDKPEIYFKADADYADLDPILKIVYLWIRPDFDRSRIFDGVPDSGYEKRMVLSLDLNINNANIYNKKAKRITAKIIYRNYMVYLSRLQFSMYNGNIQSDGEVNIKGHIPRLNFNVAVNQVNTELLINDLSNEKYLTGSLNSNFVLESRGRSEKEIINNLKLKGSYNLESGELLGYLNIIKPIASIGKIINFTGPPGKSTGFETIEGHFLFQRRVVYLQDMRMKGVGLDAIGSGRVGLDSSINVRVTVSLGGVAGKVLKLPIIYKGVFGKSLPYVDPIWLGSIYIGTIFLAGPVGATVGGIAGSAASDYINKAITGVKSFFFGKESTEDNPPRDD